MGQRKSAAAAPVHLLRNWNTLNKRLLSLTEREVALLLDHEKSNDDRITFVLRLHSRLNKLRTERERRELVKGRA